MESTTSNISEKTFIPPTVLAAIENQNAIHNMKAPEGLNLEQATKETFDLITTLYPPQTLLSVLVNAEKWDDKQRQFRNEIRYRMVPSPGPETFETFTIANMFRHNVEFKTNIYIGVNPRKPEIADGNEHSGGGKGGVLSAAVLHADIDGMLPFEVAEALEKVGLDAIIMGSGNGTHAYLVLQEPILLGSQDEIEKIETLNRRFAALFGSAADLNAATVERHLMRFPGFINWPNAAKRAKGRLPNLVTLHKLTKTRYSINELLEMDVLPEIDQSGVANVNQKPITKVDESELKDPNWRGYKLDYRQDRYRKMIMSPKVPKSIQGQGGDAALLYVTRCRFGFGLAAEDALPILKEYNEKKAEPKWTEAAIKSKLRYATYRGTVGDKLSDTAELPAVPQFPLDVLSPTIRQFVEHVAELGQTPPDLPAQYCLAAISAVVGRGSMVDWRQGKDPLNGWFLTVLEASEHKSSSVDYVVPPLVAEQEAAMKDYAKAFAKYEAERIILQKRKEAEEAQIKKGKFCGSSKIAEIVEQLTELVPPPEPTYLLNDTTNEALNTAMAANKHAAMITAEAELIENISGRYSKGTANFRNYLKFWKGDMNYVNRSGRKEDAKGFLTIGIACQMSALRELAGVKNSKEHGLLSRFLFCMPVSKVGKRSQEEIPRNESVLAGWSEFVNLLPRENLTLTLSAEAKELLKAWRYNVEGRLTGNLHGVADWAGKAQVGHTVRLAGLLYFIHGQTGCVISGQIMAMAIRLVKYYEAHAMHAYEKMVKTANHIAENILQWSRSGHAEFTLAQYTKNHRFPTAAVKDALAELQTNRLIVETEGKYKVVQY